ncbi:MAG TPA: MtsA protein [Myxococcaceae bacterium]|nr:MtsA protein [Myxococcaceae bacterium]
MMRRRPGILLAAVVAGAALVIGELVLHLRGPAPVLRDLGPRQVSNQTSQPLALVGDHFYPGMTLVLGPPFQRELKVTVLDARHGYARLPADLTLPAATVQVAVPVQVSRGRSAPPVTLLVVNDQGFPDLTSLASTPDGARVWAASLTTDQLVGVDPSGGPAAVVAGGDGPSALAAWASGGRQLLAVAHAWAPELWVCDGLTGARLRTLPAPASATGVVVDPGRNLALVSEHAADTVVALSLEDGRVLWRARVAPNPRPLAVVGERLVVGSEQTGELETVGLEHGEVGPAIAPGPETPILGGHTEPYARYAMGGKAPRALAWSASLRRLFVTSIGPNIGPNPDRMEVSMNGGVGVVDVERGVFERHLGFGWGVPQGLALDEGAGVLYVADIGTGLVRGLDARALARDDASARGAPLFAVPIPPPEGFPTARPREDYGIRGRAGVEMHSGPQALALAPDGGTLWVLDRFTGTLAELDVRGARAGRAAVRRQVPLLDVLAQGERRLGQILYFTDMGHSAMSCDACHLEGHGEGVLFEKTRPMRIYRSPTVRGTRETPPYFTPASTFTLEQTMITVGDRNRYFNPRLTESEVRRLSLFSAALSLLPNPFVGPDGAPPASVSLPDGERGDARAGLLLFEGKAACAECHPAPYFTLDQWPKTRGQYLDVGTPHLLPLRPELQDSTYVGMPPPALAGAWDVFPMLSTGAGGLSVGADGKLHVRNRFALRDVLENYSHAPLPRVELTPGERNDLLAYLLTL